MMSGNDKMSKPDFDDSCRSGATHSNLSISDRSAFDGDDLFGGKSKLTRSCLLVKTQQDSLRQLPASELKSSIRSTTSSTVSFDKVTLRSYDVIVTDNPSTTSGPPIGLGWSYDKTHETCDVDAYESCRQPRSKKEFLLPSSERWDILRLTGNYSNTDLKKASDEVKERQAQRRRSLRRQERMEGLTNAIRRIVLRRKGNQ